MNKVNLLKDNISETFIKYLVPSVSATIMISFNYFVDTLCIGQKLGERGLAALNLSWPITTVLYSIGLMIGVGGGAMFSSYNVKNEKKQARSVYTSSLLIILVLSAVITYLGIRFLEPIVNVLGGGGDLKQGTTDYVKWVLIFTIAYMGECFYTTFIRNDNAPRLAMAGTLLAGTFNVVFDILFIFVFDWGMAGASLATSLAVTSTVLLGIASSFRKKSNMKISFAHLGIGKILTIMKVGMSTFLTEVDIGIVTFVFNIVLIRISGNFAASAVAIYGIVVNINTIVLAAVNGISNAMQPIVSANIGAGKLFRVKKFTDLAVKWAIGMSIIFVILIEWKAELLVKVFLEPNDIFLQQAAYALRLVGASYILGAINIVLVSYFQSIQAAKQAIFFSLIRTLILPIAVVIGCAFFLGIKGVWLTSVIVEATTIVILAFSYQYYHRMRLEQNLAQLNFYDIEEEVYTLEEIIEQLGADNLASYKEIMDYCSRRDELNEGIPMIIGLDDLTTRDNITYTMAKEDEKISFTLAMGSLIFADLFNQTREVDKSGKNTISLSMSALVEKFFHLKTNESSQTEIISFREAIPSRWKGDNNESEL